MTVTILDRTIRQNLGLISSLASEHLDEMADKLLDGFTQGKSLKELTDSIEHLTSVNRSKAKFWARDQAGKFFGAITRERQTSAGIPGYIWRCLPGARDNHAAVNGRYFNWKNPPAVGSKGKRVHPGEDYNCRCWPEPAFGQEYEERSEQNNPIETNRGNEPRKNIETAKTKKEALGYLQSLMGDNRDYPLYPRFKHPKRALSNGNVKTGIFGTNHIDLNFMNNFNNEFIQLANLCDKLNIPRIRRVSFIKSSKQFNGRIGDGALDIVANPMKAVKSIWKKGDNIIKRPWSASGMSVETDRRLTTMYHELGHHIHQSFGKSFEMEIHYIAGKFYPTTYSTHNSLEWFAENFALYMTDKRDLVCSKFLDFVHSKGIL